MNDALKQKLLDAIGKLMCYSQLQDEEIEQLLDFVERNLSDPNIYTYLMREDTSHTTAEAILERALSYQPIQLPDQSK